MPFQVPLVEVSVEPTLSSPLIVGGAVFDGTTVLAACPVRATPKIDPIAIAAIASSSTDGQRRPKVVMRVIRLPLVGCPGSPIGRREGMR